MSRPVTACMLLLILACAYAFQTPQRAPAERIADPFATGWMLVDTNADGIADFINGKVVVPTHPSAAENAAAANLAARLGYGTTGLTPPLVVNTPAPSGIFVGKVAELPVPLEAGEGAVLAAEGNLAVTGADDDGLLAAADAYSARAPYQWKVPGEKIAAIADAVRAAAPEAELTLAGITYLRGKAGIHRALLRSRGAVSQEVLQTALGKLAGVQQLVVIGGATAAKSTPEPNQPAPQAAPQEPADTANAAPVRLDLGTLYTSRGLFTGTPRMPLPSTLSAHLYVPAGEAGVAMANVAARMGMEATGISLPLATPVDRAYTREVRNHAVIAGDGAVAQDARKKLLAADTAAAESESPLTAGEGELRVVDDVFGRRSAVMTTGDDAGAAAALELASSHLPNLWEQGKQYPAIDEIRYELHQFFSRRSAAGQAAAGLYHLDRWLSALQPSDVRDVKAELYVDIAAPGLKDLITRSYRGRITATPEVAIASLRAGTQCCDKLPDLHFRAPDVPFRQPAATFVEDITIPWEGRRLVDAVRRAAARITPGQEVKLTALVSEGPDQRRKLEAQIRDLLTKAGAPAASLQVRVLCAYKPGYSWLMDDVAPALEKRPVARMQIDFARNIDNSGLRAMHSPARWVHELYPVDEMLARKLNLPLERITLHQVEEPPANGPTYRARAYDAAGKEILTREFKVPTVMQPYNGVITRYEEVQVDTGWVRLEAGGKPLLDERIKTDPELFWEHYQNKTLPRVYETVMKQAHGELRTEFQPPFDTLKIDIHMSEPDYNLDLDQERISALEALQEDTFYSTANFISMWGDLETGRPMNYTGRIIPIVHRSEDGSDGRVHIEFYAKPAPHPLVRLSWTDAGGRRRKLERSLPPIAGEMQPRLVQARVKAGEPGIQRLMWVMAADFKDDRYDDWLKVEGQDQVDRTIFSVEQARGQVDWLERMHAAGLYRDALAYPHLKQLAMEFELPLDPKASADSPAPREFVSWAVAPPATPRPMIGSLKKIETTPFVQWDEPIGPSENAAVLARLATYPGVNVYWMGRSYLGEDLWAADITLPTPAVLRSWAKETTTKPVIVYSGRQHANEVSSTSHILKLAEELVTDAQKRNTLRKVNVAIHPITNPDGAQLSMDLAKITPDNMLHPGYHGALSADVSAGQTEPDPIYPESRTRRQLVEAWLPDAFLNPHGYPSHEWVQPFSEYTGWVQSRQGANPGRAWWIPRGWFTSLGYLRDENHPYSKMVAYAIQDRIVAAVREVPGLLPLEERMNSRYERFGQRWQPRDMFQPIVNGIRIYMSLKGAAGPRGGAAGEAGAAGAAAPGSGGVTGLSPFVTWDAAYTEAPDETAHGDYLKLVSATGLAFDWVHLRYLADGEHRITHTEREAAGAVQYRVERARPVLPH